MDKTKIGVIAATAILGLGALGGAAVKANAGSAPVKSAAPSVAVQAEAPEADAGMPDTDNVQSGDQSGPDTTVAGQAEAPEADAGKPDTDNVQLEEGDQTTPDAPGASVGK